MGLSESPLIHPPRHLSASASSQASPRTPKVSLAFQCSNQDHWPQGFFLSLSPQFLLFKKSHLIYFKIYPVSTVSCDTHHHHLRKATVKPLGGPLQWSPSCLPDPCLPDALSAAARVILLMWNPNAPPHCPVLPKDSPPQLTQGETKSFPGPGGPA